MERNPDQIFDEFLVIRCQDHDDQAYALLWGRWQPKILQWSNAFIKDGAIAEEIAQESWVSIYKGIGRLRDPAMFRFWAYKIVKRRAADWIRKEQRKRNSLEQVKLGQSEVAEVEEGAPDPVNMVLETIQALPADHQQILRLFYLEKTPVKKIAYDLSLPEGTVKSRLHYARELLKKKLKEKDHE